MLSEMDKEILRGVLKDPATGIAISISTTKQIVEKWLFACCEIFNKVYLDNGQVVLALTVTSQLDSSIKFSSEVAQHLVNNNRETAEIDLNLNVAFNSNLRSGDQIEIAQYGEQNKGVILRLDGEVLEVYINGLYKNRINVRHPLSKSEKRVGKNQRSHKDYKLLVDDHGKKKLVNIMDQYWKDRNNRILIPGKTEAFFQKSLYDWLLQYLSDGYPKLETKTHAGDRTDIDIFAYYEGTHYIIEIKWLGKNENGTEYKYDRIIEGIGQIVTYIERDENIKEVCLVFYDGRPEEEYLTNSNFDETLIPCKGDCKIIFLESETASAKGKKYANRSQLGS